MSQIEEIYTPPKTLNLSQDTARQQVRLGIQGYPKTGKTWSALTFKNPIVMNLDRGLGAHAGRSDVIDVPFYDGAFCDSIIKRNGVKTPPNRRDAITIWLSTEGMKLTTNQTLIVDGGTVLENSFHTQYALSPVFSRSSGEEDKFAQWRLKNDYFAEVFELLKSLKCDVVYLSHEAQDRNDKGDLNGQVRPILTGQFGDKMAGYCTDWFRQWAIAKPISADEKLSFLQKTAFKNQTLMDEMISSTPPDNRTIYLWQTSSDGIAKCGSSTLINPPHFIIASFKSFEKYGRKSVIQ